MTKLLTYYDLCSISDHKEFLGLSEDSEQGTVINTLGRNIFLSIQVNITSIGVSARFESHRISVVVKQSAASGQLDGTGKADKQSRV